MCNKHKIDKIPIYNFINGLEDFFKDIDYDFNGLNGFEYMIEIEDGEYITQLENCYRDIEVKSFDDAILILDKIKSYFESDDFYKYVDLQHLIVDEHNIVISICLIENK